ncbi:hypothetical protein HRbin29_00653 [bacterium HR29]|nr:hypothetical protein HRbin29_00653 [bacterium HR29]
MQTQYIARTDGRPPLRFQGERLARLDTHWDRGREQTRWWQLEVYRTAAGRYVLVAAYRTAWQGERDEVTADVLDDLGQVPELLEERGVPAHLISELCELLDLEEIVP